ncbi:hypothetical protein Ahy_B09g099088 [Arachis hypogaea]|uniref:Uncharacterized protein n=1 Tax=Arachis hypogaea TaxID=3818 RepID=A0A444XTQ9_ARAHY|nr:hypothetical protein Ahy_B09g099088 [Arachis hypogaea]
MTLILLCLQQTKDLKCATRLLSEKFEIMSKPKKAIIRELGFGGLMHIPPMNVPYKLLKELANSFNLDKNNLDTSYGDLFPNKVSYKELSEENKLIFRRFQGKTLKNLIDEIMNIVSPVHLAPIFQMDKIMEGNWGGHMLNFIIKGITNYRLKKKKSIDGCLYVLMIVYFHLSKHADKKGEANPGPLWVSHWNRERR